MERQFPPELHSTFKRVLADKADTFTPYGATEALPIANISGSEVLSSTAQDSLAGKGTCVGRPFPGVTIKVIPIHDNIYENFCDSMALEPNQIGEVCVNGPMVTEEYYNRSDATSLAKMKSNKGTWHRMGDLGYIDDQGRLWFCGRKSHRVTSSEGVFFPVPIESVFNQHQLIRRSALVGVGPYGNQKMILILEPNHKNLLRDKTMQKEVILELLELASPYDSASKVSNFLWHECLPTDIRHNAKIFREKLAQWAEQQISSGDKFIMIRALVTGGGGFLGSSIARLLVQKGWKVYVLGRSAYPELETLNIKCYRIDLSRADQLQKQIEPVDVVFHVAAKAGIWGNYASYYEANVMATRHTINYCKILNIPLVYTSSPSVIFNGSDMNRANESVPYPNHYHSYYPETKAIAEREVLQAAKNGQLKACSLRPHLIWGPGDNHLIPRFLKRGKAGSIAVVGNGNNMVDTVYVEDCCICSFTSG